MDDFISLFSYPFIRNSLITGLLVGYTASYYGVFVVQKELSFLGSGLAHAAFGGVALGILIGTEPLYTAVPFTVLVSLGITYVKEKTILSGDTAIGIFFSVAVALGLIFLSYKKALSTDASSYLFGSILAVNVEDLITTACLAAFTILTWPLWGRLALAVFDPEIAATERLPVRRDNYILSVLLSVTIVLSIKLVGIILIAAFLVIPAASARLISHTFREMTFLSIIFGMLGSTGGLLISYMMDLPAGASIILLQALFFMLMLMIRGIRK